MVYLLHFERPIGDLSNPHGQAQHYLGYAERDVEARLAVHLTGRGAKIVKAAVQQGIKIELIRVWPGGDRTFERRLKRANNLPRLCRRCNPDGWATRRAIVF